MSKSVKYSCITFTILLLLILLIPPLISLDKYKNIIGYQVRQSINRDLTINGNIKLSLLPRPKIKIEDVKLSSLEGATYPNFLELKSVEAGVGLISLLQGKIVLAYLKFENPQIILERLSNGKSTWEFELKKEESKINIETDSSKKPELPFDIKRVIVNKASIRYIDNKSDYNVNDLTLNLQTSNIKGPMNFDLSFNIFNQNLNMNGVVKEIGEVIPLMIEMKGAGDLILNLTGNLDVAKFSFLGDLKGKGDIKPLETYLKGLPEGLKGSYNFLAKIEVSKEKAKIGNINLQIGELSAVGEAYYTMRDSASNISLTLNPGNIALSVSPANAVKDSITNKVILVSPSIKPFLEALKIDTQDLPGFLFQKISLTSELEYQTEELNLRSIDFSLGDSKVQGMIGVKNQEGGNVDSLYDLKTNDAASLAKLFTGANSLKLGNLRIKGTTFKRNDTLKTDTEINLANSDISIKGEVKPYEEMGVDLKINVNGKSLDRTLLEFSPNTLGGLGAFNLFMNLSGKLKKTLNIAIDNSFINLGQERANLKGNVALETNKNKPKILMGLVVSSLNLDNLGTKRGTENYNAVNTENKERRSKRKLDLSFLNSFDGNFSLDIGKITSGALVFDNLKALVLLNEGNLELKKLTGDISGGKMEGEGALSSNKAGDFYLKLSLNNARLKNIIPPQGKIKVTDGTINFNSDLKSNGESEYQYVNNLRGNVSVRGVDGRVSGFDLSKIANALNNAKDLKTIISALDDSVLKGTTEFKTLNGDLAIEKGIAKITKAELIADNGSVTANGIINLPRYVLDINAIITINAKNVPPFVAHLYGPLDQPQYKLDYNELKKYLMNNVLTKVIDNIKSGKSSPSDILKSVIGGREGNPEASQEASPETQNSGSEQPKQADPAKELINKGLKKLFK